MGGDVKWSTTSPKEKWKQEDQMFFSSYNIYQIIQKMTMDEVVGKESGATKVLKKRIRAGKYSLWSFFRTFTYMITKIGRKNISWAIQGPTLNPLEGEPSPLSIFQKLPKTAKWNIKSSFIKSFDHHTNTILTEIREGLEEEEAEQRESPQIESPAPFRPTTKKDALLYSKLLPKFLFVSKRLGDQGQALACLRNPLMPYNPNSPEDAVNVFVTYDRLALAAALTYRVDAAIFAFPKNKGVPGKNEGIPHGAFIIIKKNLETAEARWNSLKEKIEKINENISSFNVKEEQRKLAATKINLIAIIEAQLTTIETEIEQEEDNINRMYTHLLNYFLGNTEGGIHNIITWKSKEELFKQLKKKPKKKAGLDLDRDTNFAADIDRLKNYYDKLKSYNENVNKYNNISTAVLSPPTVDIQLKYGNNLKSPKGSMDCKSDQEIWSGALYLENILTTVKLLQKATKNNIQSKIEILIARIFKKAFDYAGGEPGIEKALIKLTTQALEAKKKKEEEKESSGRRSRRRRDKPKDKDIYDILALRATFKRIKNYSGDTLYSQKLDNIVEKSQNHTVALSHYVASQAFNHKNHTALNILAELEPESSLSTRAEYAKEDAIIQGGGGNIDEQIFLQTVGGRLISIDVNLTDTIEDVKQKIQKVEGIRVKDQRLIYRGDELEDEMTLASYDISRGIQTQKDPIHLRRLTYHEGQMEKNIKYDSVIRTYTAIILLNVYITREKLHEGVPLVLTDLFKHFDRHLIKESIRYTIGGEKGKIIAQKKREIKKAMAEKDYDTVQKITAALVKMQEESKMKKAERQKGKDENYHHTLQEFENKGGYILDFLTPQLYRMGEEAGKKSLGFLIIKAIHDGTLAHAGSDIGLLEKIVAKALASIVAVEDTDLESHPQSGIIGGRRRRTRRKRRKKKKTRHVKKKQVKKKKKRHTRKKYHRRNKKTRKKHKKK